MVPTSSAKESVQTALHSYIETVNRLQNGMQSSHDGVGLQGGLAMATVLNRAKVSAVAQVPPVVTRSSNARWISPTLMMVVCAIIGILMIGARLYQQAYAWSAGLDATSPEFQTYWMNLLFGQFAVEVLAAAGIWSYVW